MATKNKSHLPVPKHVQALIDALEALGPAHWTARHGDGKASDEWFIYSEVFRGRIDDLKQAGEKGRGGYRVGIEVLVIDGQIETTFSLFDNPIAARKFKANFRSELLQPLKDFTGARNIDCGSWTLKSGKAKSTFARKLGLAGSWIERWLNDPSHYDEGRLNRFSLNVGILSWDSPQRLIDDAAALAAAYLPLLECMVPLEGEPLDPKRETRNARLRAKLAKVTGPVKQCSCEHRKIQGLDSRFACGGPLEGAHIKPYQQGGSDEASNGLWLCRVHHCETEGRIEGNRLSVRLLDHLPQARHSRLETVGVGS